DADAAARNARIRLHVQEGDLQTLDAGLRRLVGALAALHADRRGQLQEVGDLLRIPARRLAVAGWTVGLFALHAARQHNLLRLVAQALRIGGGQLNAQTQRDDRQGHDL